MTHPLCHRHNDRLAAIESTLEDHGAKLDFIADVLRPPPTAPAGARLTLSWGKGKVQGSAPWVVAVMALLGAFAFAWHASGTASTRPVPAAHTTAVPVR